MNSPEPLQQKTWVKEVMKNSIISVDSSVTATDAAKMMEDTGVGSYCCIGTEYAYWSCY